MEAFIKDNANQTLPNHFRQSVLREFLHKAQQGWEHLHYQMLLTILANYCKINEKLPIPLKYTKNYQILFFEIQMGWIFK